MLNSCQEDLFASDSDSESALFSLTPSGKNEGDVDVLGAGIDQSKNAGLDDIDLESEFRDDEVQEDDVDDSNYNEHQPMLDSSKHDDDGHHQPRDSRASASPVESASWLSRVFFSWTSTLLDIGASRSIYMNDIPPVPVTERTQAVSERFQTHWRRRLAHAARRQEEDGDPYVQVEPPSAYDDDDVVTDEGDDVTDRYSTVSSASASPSTSSSSSPSKPFPSASPESFSSASSDSSATGFDGSAAASTTSTPRLRLRPKHQASLLGALRDVFGRTFFAAAIYKLLSDCALFFRPLAVNRIIASLSQDDAPLWQGLVWVGSMLLVSVIQSLCLQAYEMRCLTIGMNVRAALVDAIYEKTLRLSRQERQYVRSWSHL